MHTQVFFMTHHIETVLKYFKYESKIASLNVNYLMLKKLYDWIQFSKTYLIFYRIMYRHIKTDILHRYSKYNKRIVFVNKIHPNTMLSHL